MSSIVPVQRQQYDLLLKHKSPMALRLNDPHHSQIKVGDVIDVSGHNTIMDRERFKVIDRMHHPSIHHAVEHIKQSDLSVRDKIQMKQAFLGVHGAKAEHKPVVSLHLQAHPPTPQNYTRPPSSLG
ncbi:MAG TPA: hypothetical protein VMR98_06175 [Candidatus Polarisedimenticolaceae bacterium]|nr:hypothetical protein [Candidatus Polarisedimenticolaceae bacterium]